MPLSMHQASVPIFVQMLTNALAWLDKAEAHAKAKKFSPDVWVTTRLTPDMLPFSAQIGIATDHVKGCVARLAGVQPPKWADDEKTLDELRARLRKALDYAQSIPAAQLEGSETREVSLPLGSGALKMTGEAYLKGFALPNFFFHVTMAYAILRHGGVDVGKMDYLGGAPR